MTRTRTFLSMAAVALALNLTARDEADNPKPSQSWIDRELTREVERRLQKTDNAHAVDVQVNDQTVTLTGQIENYAAKRRLGEIAAGLRGVKDVQNKLEVALSGPRDDRMIESRVEAGLSAEISTALDEIEVTARNGWVMLSGTVDSFHERRMAEEIAADTAGVLGVSNALALRVPEEREDTEIEADVESALAWDTRVDSSEIEAEVSEGAVYLTGNARNAREKKWAYYNAWVAGVKRVDASNLQVENVTQETREQVATRRNQTEASGAAATAQQGTGQPAGTNDRSMQEALRRALRGEARLSDDELQIAVNGGIVTLQGAVDTQHERFEAARVAERTRGVRRVYNLLKVRPENRPGDRALAENIRAAFRRDAQLERPELRVTVANGKAWLGGRVDTVFEKNRAYQVASRVPGVMAIQNNIEVEPWNADAMSIYSVTPLYMVDSFTWSDSQTQADIENQMFWSPFVDADEVNVSVENGRATLTGTVESLAEKRAATENAYEGGATAVENQLSIGDPGMF